LSYLILLSTSIDKNLVQIDYEDNKS